MVARKRLRAESFQQNLRNKSVDRDETFSQTFLINHVEQLSVPNFVAVSGNLGEKIPVVDDVLSSQEQEIYPTISLDENCIEFEFQTDWNYYVDLRQTNLALKLKFVRGRGYKPYNSKEVKKERKEAAKAEEEQTAKEAPVPLVTHINNILHSIFPSVEVYINNQQIYNS